MLLDHTSLPLVIQVLQSIDPVSTSSSKCDKSPVSFRSLKGIEDELSGISSNVIFTATIAFDYNNLHSSKAHNIAYSLTLDFLSDDWDLDCNIDD